MFSVKPQLAGGSRYAPCGVTATFSDRFSGGGGFGKVLGVLLLTLISSHRKLNKPWCKYSLSQDCSKVEMLTVMTRDSEAGVAGGTSLWALPHTHLVKRRGVLAKPAALSEGALPSLLPQQGNSSVVLDLLFLWWPPNFPPGPWFSWWVKPNNHWFYF